MSAACHLHLKCSKINDPHGTQAALIRTFHTNNIIIIKSQLRNWGLSQRVESELQNSQYHLLKYNYFFMLTSKECVHRVISLFYPRALVRKWFFAAHIYTFPTNIIATSITIQHIGRCTEPTARLCILGVSHKYWKVSFSFLFPPRLCQLLAAATGAGVFVIWHKGGPRH